MITQIKLCLWAQLQSPANVDCNLIDLTSLSACRLADELHMPSLPEMMFGDNILRIQHDYGFGIEFNATDALKCVNNYQGMIKVACAEEWQESR